MVQKINKPLAVIEILSRETNSRVLNPKPNKIDSKLLIKHLHKKDEHTNIDLQIRPFYESRSSDNQLRRNITFDRDAEDESTSSNQKNAQAKNAIKKRMQHLGRTNLHCFGIKMKTKHKHLPGS